MADNVTEQLVTLSAMVGFEAVPIHSTVFPTLWLEVLKSDVSRIKTQNVN